MKVIINIHESGRPTGATATNTRIRKGFIIKAKRLGMSRKAIAKGMGLSYNTVCKALK